MTNKLNLAIAYCALLASAALPALADSIAKHVVAEEITGVVVEAGTGKPIPNAIVAIRFERGNTGHGSPHCFRSMAVEADAQGRFRFAPWSQDDTLADAAFGEVAAYKAGYIASWRRQMFVLQAMRTILGIPFSDTIRFPRQELRLEMQQHIAPDQGRMNGLRSLVGRFTCRWQAESDDMVLMTTVRKEIAASPIANQKEPQANSYTHLEWIDNALRSYGPQSTDPRAIAPKK